MSPLKAEQTQLTEPFLKTEMLQSLQHLCSIHWRNSTSLMSRTGHCTPDLPQQGQAEGQDQLPQPAGNALPKAQQDLTGPWPRDTGTVCGSPGHPRLSAAAPSSSAPAWTGVTPPQVEDPVPALAEVLTVPSCPPLQPVQALLQGCTALGGTGNCSCSVSAAQETPAPSPNH